MSEEQSLISCSGYMESPSVRFVTGTPAPAVLVEGEATSIPGEPQPTLPTGVMEVTHPMAITLAQMYCLCWT